LDRQIKDKSMFLHYFCNTFNKLIRPALYNTNDKYSLLNNQNLEVYDDQKPRTPK